MSDWRAVLRQNFTDIRKLVDFLELDDTKKKSVLARPRFPLNLPKRLAEKMAKNSLNDPLFKQFVPLQDEALPAVGFSTDPVADRDARCGDHLLHKYPGRALLLCTSACAMHCRYCFRQHFDYHRGEKRFDAALQWIAADSSLSEIILSGGDPLSLGNATLGTLLEGLGNIAHVKRVRFHTRFLIGIPERVDEELLRTLSGRPFQLYVVVHVNHPRELDDAVLHALKRVQQAGVPILNQSVLLRGVNDDVETLHALSEALASGGILPYYLHQLDRVQGAEHFEVEEEAGRRLVAALQERLPGYAVPKYVKEVPGRTSKSAITSWGPS
jgi:EF-P beta-lysylation protein EpmB